MQHLQVIWQIGTSVFTSYVSRYYIEERPRPMAPKASESPWRRGVRAWGRARALILPFGFCLSEGRTGDVPSRGVPAGKRTDRKLLI